MTPFQWFMLIIVSTVTSGIVSAVVTLWVVTPFKRPLDKKERQFIKLREFLHSGAPLTTEALRKIKEED